SVAGLGDLDGNGVPDIAIGADTSYFSFSEVRVGLVPATISVLVVRKIGEQQTRRLFLTGERFGAEQAKAIGLIHEVVAPDRLDAKVTDLVKEILRCGPNAVATAKEVIREGLARPRDEAIDYTVDLGLAAEDPSTDETIDQFGTRRLGRAFAEIMLDPMVKGVFGGESKRLSLAAAFPRMIELEKDYGGLFKAMTKLARQKKKEGKSKTDAGPSGVLHSFTGGMASLIDAVAAELAADPLAEIMTNADVQKISRVDDRWSVTTAAQGSQTFDIVIEAAPAHAAAQHLGHLDPVFADHLAAIPFAPMAVIALGFPREAVHHDLNGFGMLVPTREKRELLGVLWTSSIFGGRAPDGQVL
ncbi:MAG: protoporphyrinogen oxidase, partial [Pseudomonadota bacterium]